MRSSFRAMVYMPGLPRSSSRRTIQSGTRIVRSMTHTSTLSSSERERYSRHLMLPEIGIAGQEKLKAARVLVVGAGGLGSPASL